MLRENMLSKFPVCQISLQLIFLREYFQVLKWHVLTNCTTQGLVTKESYLFIEVRQAGPLVGMAS